MKESNFDRFPLDTLLILMDFAAVMSLCAFQTKNSAVNDHAVCNNFVCIWNRRSVHLTKKRK